jgi:hypothetical protein
MKVRRVVTGHTRDGKATVASDTEVDAITLGMLPGTEFYRLVCQRRHSRRRITSAMAACFPG